MDVFPIFVALASTAVHYRELYVDFLINEFIPYLLPSSFPLEGPVD